LHKYDQPDLLILDLALTDAETDDLESEGGTDASGQRQPTRALNRTTGFKILKYVASQSADDAPIPLVTTLASNPRVTSACLNEGAFGVVVKPAGSSVMPFFYDVARNPAVQGAASRRLIKQATRLAPAIDNYLTQLACETRKAVREAALRRSRGHAPLPVPFWAAHDRLSLKAKALKDTNLLLMDVRGFSRLVALGIDKPEAVFDLMNLIWEHVLGVLAKYDAEVNNFIGDAALVFRGVYSRNGTSTMLQGTIDCARELCAAFASDGPMRKALLDAISSAYGSILYAHANAGAMLSHVRSENFGLRVVIADPDEKEGLYGTVGSNRRWQHTILSRFMNALARAESAVGKWEKAGELEMRAAHCFLLWDTARALPALDNVEWEKAADFLGKEYDAIRDVPEPLQIFRVKWRA
jgi:hypothetical protein